MRFGLRHFALLGALAGSTLLGAAACAGNDSSKSGELGKVSQAIETGVDGGATLALLNEIKVDPPGADAPYEYVELKGTPSGSLEGFYLIAIEGDSGTAGAGTADYVLNLGTACGGSACSFGANGLLIVKAATGGHTVVGATTVVTDPQLNAGASGGSGMENGTITFMLVYSPTNPIVRGTDYDGDAGTFALPAGAVISDSVGWTDGGSGDVVYGGVQIATSGFTPDGVVRFADDETPMSADAWYAGDLVGTVDAGDGGTASDPSSTTFSSTEITPNVAAGAQLTPGGINTGVKSVDAGVTPDTSLPEAASEVAVDAVDRDDGTDTAVTDAPGDTGTTTDTGTVTDGASDSGTADTGTSTDSGEADTGTVPPEDTGGPLFPDTGSPVRDTGTADTGSDVAPPVTTDDEGCGCRTPGSSSTNGGAAFAALALAGLIAARRRR